MNKKIILYVFPAIVIVGLFFIRYPHSPEAHAQNAVTTVTFQKGDAKGTFSETDDGTLTSNTGAAATANNFKLGRKDSSLYRTTIKFPNIVGIDANQIPAGVKVTSAILKIKTGTGAYYHTAQNVTVEAHKILESWDEIDTGSVFVDSPSWNNRIKGLHADDPNSRWVNLGAGTPTSSSGVIEGSVNLSNAYNAVYSIDVTQAAQSWVNLTSPNHGIVLRLTDETTMDTSKIFYSSEAINVVDRPSLEITYELANPQDVSAPIILLSTPSGILPQDTTSATLSVKTNENATCKYSKTVDISYEAMTGNLINSNYQDHAVTLSGLTPGSHNYYVKCIDFSSNVMAFDHAVLFSITPDLTPPAQITNLSISNCTSNSCALSWTTPGDDGNVGKSSKYDIRYSLTPINDLNWASATQMFGEPQPQSPGAIQNTTINGLIPGTKFYFGIKTADEAPNHSIISNVINGTTLLLPQSASLKAWTVSSMEKIRPFDTQGTATSISLSSAINEYEPFQVMITSENEKLEDVDMVVNLPAPFTSTIYKEDFVHIVTPSNMYGDTGEWPDILIPKVDDYYKETRNAFPMQVSNISRAYPLIASLPQQSYGPGKDGYWFSNVEPPSKFVYPYNGGSKGGGKSGNNNTGTGKVTTGGFYYGSTNARYIVVVENSGSINTATFKWSPDGGLNFNSGVPISPTPILLDNGITVTFTGAGLDTDFIAGDEWVFYASPKRNQPVWIDVYAPKNTQPGNYSGSVTITAKNKTAVTIPITIKIWNFQLPDTSSLKNYFGLGSNFTRGHKVPDGVPLNHLYAISGLRHRISLSNAFEAQDAVNGGMACWSYNEASGVMNINFAQFDAKIGPFLAGTGTTPLYPNIPFPGKFTIYTSEFIHFGSCPAVDVDKRRRVADKMFADHLKEKGWFDRWYVYLHDEPSFGNQAHWDNIIARGTRFKASVPDVPLFVTTTLDYGTKKNVLDYTDIFVDYHLTADYDKKAVRAEYDNWLATPDTPRHELWSYVACGSCWNVGGSYFQGESNHGIDYTPNQLRIRTWLDRFYDVEAELYYAVNENWGRYPINNLDPWENTYWFGNNGDGQLFYPGRPDRIGGTTHIPVESLRLKLVRESFEDYEYIYKLDQANQKAFVDAELAKIIIDSLNFTQGASDILQSRKNLATKIESLGGNVPPSPTPPQIPPPVPPQIPPQNPPRGPSQRPNADTTAPNISSIKATATTDSATITWATNEPAYGQVRYGLTTSYGQFTHSTKNLFTSHTRTIPSLTASTTYNYRVVSTDINGNTATSPNYTLTTQTATSTEPAPPTQKTEAPSSLPQATSTISYTFTKNLKIGLKNDEDVKNLQKILVLEEAFPEGVADGHFGKKTQNAVIDFQKKYNISPSTGNVGPLTRTKLNALYGDTTVTTTPKITSTLKIGTRSSEVTLLQEMLSKDPTIYPEGLVTGYFGTATQRAVKKFQTKYQITPVSGVVGPLTRAKLDEVWGVK